MTGKNLRRMVFLPLTALNIRMKLLNSPSSSMLFFGRRRFTNVDDEHAIRTALDRGVHKVVFDDSGGDM